MLLRVNIDMVTWNAMRAEPVERQPALDGAGGGIRYDRATGSFVVDRAAVLATEHARRSPIPASAGDARPLAIRGGRYRFSTADPSEPPFDGFSTALSGIVYASSRLSRVFSSRSDRKLFASDIFRRPNLAFHPIAGCARNAVIAAQLRHHRALLGLLKDADIRASENCFRFVRASLKVKEIAETWVYCGYRPIPVLPRRKSRDVDSKRICCPYKNMGCGCDTSR